jgi:hypothetical protein
MVEYRCYVLDAEDHILQAFEIECGDDVKAEVAAEDLLARDPYHRSVEVWQRARRIAKLERNAVAGRQRSLRMPRTGRAGVFA